MTTSIQELNVTEDLKKCGVTRLAKESSRFLLEYQGKAVVIFTIEDKELFATLQNFEDRSKGRIDRQTQEAIKFCLSKDEYYVNALLSRGNGNKAPRFVIGQESTTTDQHYEKNNEQTQTETLSVEQAIRRNKGRLTVPGMIIGLSSVEQIVTSTEFECSDCKYTFDSKHNPPLFSLPSSLSLTKTKKCPNCNESTYGPHKHEEKSAIIIQLQDEEKQNALESLNVVLFENDTLNVRNGEKATVTGDLHVVQQRGNSKRITYLFAYGGIQYATPENAPSRCN
jgi:DNA replicative helicase MCM subunit Mcm2 (Cdc46/Mcm family)